jgi:hypothetical protein
MFELWVNCIQVVQPPHQQAAAAVRVQRQGHAGVRGANLVHHLDVALHKLTRYESENWKENQENKSHFRWQGLGWVVTRRVHAPWVTTEFNSSW